MEEYKMANIDLLGITVLLRRLCEQGKLTGKEAKRILTRIAVEIGADLIISLWIVDLFMDISLKVW